MENKSNQDAQGQKKPYTKPEVRKVTLTPEEAVLGSCKVQSGTGPAAANCGNPTWCYTHVS